MKCHDNPSEVSIELDAILVDGPGGLAVCLTLPAAEETARRLWAAAAQLRARDGSETP